MSAIYFQMFQKKYNVRVYIYIHMYIHKKNITSKCGKISIFEETG